MSLCSLSLLFFFSSSSNKHWSCVAQDGSGDIDFFEFEEMLVNGAGGPIQMLLQAIQSGELGNPKVTSVKSLMTAARRRRIVETLHGYGRRNTAINAQDVKNRRTVKELQRMAAESGGADAAVEMLMKEDRSNQQTSKELRKSLVLNEENVDEDESEMDSRMYEEVYNMVIENDPDKKRLPPLGKIKRRVQKLPMIWDLLNK